MRINWGAGHSLARTRTRSSISARTKYLRAALNTRNVTSSRLHSAKNSAASGTTAAGSAISAKKADWYEDIETAANAVGKDLEALMLTGEKALFASQKEEKASESTEQALSEGEQDASQTASKAAPYVDTLASFVKHYNEMVSGMSKPSDMINTVYLANLQKDMSGQSKALGNIGITVNKDGTLKIDKKAMENAKEEDVEGLFGSKGTVSTKVVKYAASVEKNATQNLKTLQAANSTSLNAGYNCYGRAVNPYNAGRYNYFG